jgi:hypothetical protein
MGLQVSLQRVHQNRIRRRLIMIEVGKGLGWCRSISGEIAQGNRG